jgi:hypothetical protein
MIFYKRFFIRLPHDLTSCSFGGAALIQAAPYLDSDYRVSVFATLLAVIPLTSPIINMTAGINCPTTISAKKPRKIQIKIPSFPAAIFSAAHAVAGAIVPIRVANVFMAYSFQNFPLPDVYKALNMPETDPKKFESI